MVHLHLHSKYSLRDSIIKPEELVSRLQEIGQDCVAVTDHGGSLGGVSIYKILKKSGIKYIHGCEMYVCDDVSVKDKNNRYYHLVVLCKNDTGRKNLNRLITISEHPNNKYYKPRIDFEILKNYSEGLIVSSACLAGEISQHILNDEISNAKEVALRYKSVFGEDFYLEVQSHLEENQINVNKKIVEIANKLQIKCIVTTDAHYTYEEDRKYQNKYAFNGAYKEDGESYVDCFVQDEQQVRDRLPYFPKTLVDELIQNTHVIADKCDVEMPLSAPIMPKVDTPDEYGSNKEWLENLCEDGFKEKLNIDLQNSKLFNDSGLQWTQEEIDAYISRYKYELNSLDRMGFIDYILLVYSYANRAKKRGIARGSGGGSLICYLTKITNIDPIEHDLYFERFIDVGALDLLENGKITKEELKIPD